MKRYSTPELNEIAQVFPGIICESPSPGMNEQITIQDWSDLVDAD